MQRFFYALLIGISLSGFAQMHEFGAGVGGAAYTGDVNPRFHPVFIRPAFKVFYRCNVSKVIAFKVAFNGGAIYGSEKYSKDPLPSFRQASFSSSYGALSLETEYNFINFRDKKTPIRISPYLTGGIAFYSTGPASSGNYEPEDAESNFFRVAIPFGGGVKYRLNKVWNIGWEAKAFKTFNDKVDGLSVGQSGKYLTGDSNDTDWFYQSVFTISYTIYGIKCPSEQKYQ